MSDIPDAADDSVFGSGRFDRSRQPRYVVSSSVLLTAVLCLVFVIVLITALHLYARYLLRRQARRRSAQAQSHRSVRPADPHGTVDPRVPRPTTGLNPAAVDALPKFAYKKKDQDQSKAAAVVADECSVCLSQLEEGETVRRLPACGHTFHDKCIDMWLNSHNTCPLCRKVVGPVSSNPPPLAPAQAVEVVVVVQVGVGGGGNARSSVIPQGATLSQMPVQLPAAAAAGCVGSGGGGQGGSGFDGGSGAPSRLESFRRMFSLERAGGRRQQQGDDGPHRDPERQ